MNDVNYRSCVNLERTAENRAVSLYYGKPVYGLVEEVEEE